MTFPEYESYDALGLAELARKGDIGAHELLDAAIERIEARDGTIGAIVHRMDDKARRAVDAGLPPGPFTGVPFSLKDLGIAAAGTPMTCATPLFADFVSDHDNGGSIRVPASFCGLFGLKPSRGRISAAPDFGEALAGMATSHCVSWSVRDSAALLDVSAGTEPGDPYAAPPLARPLLEEVGAPPGKLRIALLTTDFEGNTVDPECVAAAEAAAKLCESLGHQVQEGRPDLSGLSLIEAWRVLPAVNLVVTVEQRAKALGRKPAPDDLEPINWAWYELGKSFTAATISARYRRCTRSPAASRSSSRATTSS